MSADAVVLGAGAVGVSIALHLRRRGFAVTLVDTAQPGQATSYGNAGLIQTEGVYPARFPQSLSVLLRYAANRGIPMHYHARALPGLVPFLRGYAKYSRPGAYQATGRLYAPIMALALAETRALADESGSRHLLRATGWMRLFRTGQAFETGAVEAATLRQDFAVASRRLDATALQQCEPCLDRRLIGAIHFDGSDVVTDPGAFVQASFQRFMALGGVFVTGDARTLQRHGAGWRVHTVDGTVDAAQATVALGPWSDGVTRPLGYALRLAVKRGYHMHYRPMGSAVLNHPVIDAERGYLLAPMTRGIRLTTGVELARREAPPTPVQLARAEPFARSLFPLGEHADNAPWMGLRPCTPDMLPVIGPAPRHPGLWFAFGHAHHGLTLAAVTGRMIAALMSREESPVDPAPFRADRPGLQ